MRHRPDRDRSQRREAALVGPRSLEARVGRGRGWRREEACSWAEVARGVGLVGVGVGGGRWHTTFIRRRRREATRG